MFTVTPNNWEAKKKSVRLNLLREDVQHFKELELSSFDQVLFPFNFEHLVR